MTETMQQSVKEVKDNKSKTNNQQTGPDYQIECWLFPLVELVNELLWHEIISFPEERYSV